MGAHTLLLSPSDRMLRALHWDLSGKEVCPSHHHHGVRGLLTAGRDRHLAGLLCSTGLTRVPSLGQTGHC